MVSSRTEANVQKAVDALKAEGLDVAGVVCHVGKAEDRKRLVDETVKKWGGIDIFVQNAAVNPAFGLGLNVSTNKKALVYVYVGWYVCVTGTHIMHFSSLTLQYVPE
jgi:NAD(P)-dependent dehydrogenase (short-subunit alcohol dehydrogenase family)